MVKLLGKYDMIEGTCENMPTLFVETNVLFQRHKAIPFNEKKKKRNQHLKVATEILFLVCNATTARTDLNYTSYVISSKV